MANKHYYLAVAQVKDGPAHVFIIYPSGKLEETDRTIHEIETSASEKGFELSYCALYTFNIGTWTSDRLRSALVQKMKEKYADVRSEWDIEIDVKTRVLDPGEEGRRLNRRNWYGRD